MLEIVGKVADREGVPWTRLRPPLNDAIDLDALESLMTRDAGVENPVSVRFIYRGHEIVVESDGTVRVS